MSSYHGWTHRPKAQGGTDPVAFEAVPDAALFVYDLQAGSVQITTAGAWTGTAALELHRIEGRDAYLATAYPTFLDGTTATHGYEITFTEHDDNVGGISAVRPFWLVGFTVEWNLTNVADTANTAAPFDQQFGARIQQPGNSRTICQALGRAHPRDNGTGRMESTLSFPLSGSALTLTAQAVFSANEHAARQDGDGNGLYFQVFHQMTYSTAGALHAPVVENLNLWGIRYGRVVT